MKFKVYLIGFLILILGFMVSCNDNNQTTLQEEDTNEDSSLAFDQTYVYQDLLMDYYTFAYQTYDINLSQGLELDFYDQIKSVSFFVHKGYVYGLRVGDYEYVDREYIYAYMLIHFDDALGVNPHVFRVERNLISQYYSARIIEVNQNYSFDDFVVAQKSFIEGMKSQYLSDYELIDENSVYLYQEYENTYTISELNSLVGNIEIIEDDYFGYLINDYEATIIGFKEGVDDLLDISIPEKIESYDVKYFREYSFVTYDIESVFLPKTIENIQLIRGIKHVKEITIHEDNPYFKSLNNVVYNKSLDRLIMYPSQRQGLDFVLPQSVKTIGEYSFFRAPIFNMNFEEGSSLERIERFAFQQSQLKSIVLPASLKYIEQYSFENLFYLEVVTIPENSLLEYIGDYAFFNTSISSIFIPENLKTIYPSSFTKNSNLEAFLVDEDNSYFKSIDGVLFSKDEASLLAYPSHREGTSYSVNSSVKRLGTDAFAYSSLTQIIFEDENNLEIIGNRTFYNSMITSFVLPPKVNEIGVSAFSGTVQLKVFDFNNNQELKRIPDYMLSGSSIIDLYLPDQIESIGRFAFSACEYLEYIELNDSGNLKTIETYAFQGNYRLKNIFIPQSLSVIETKAFYFDDQTNIYIQENADESQWDPSWYNREQDIYRDVLDYGQFEDFIYLQLSDETLTIVKILIHDRKEEVAIPEYINENQVTRIEENVLMGEYNSLSIYIPKSILQIEAYAFSGLNGLIKTGFASKPDGWNLAWNRHYDYSGSIVVLWSQPS